MLVYEHGEAVVPGIGLKRLRRALQDAAYIEAAGGLDATRTQRVVDAVARAVQIPTWLRLAADRPVDLLAGPDADAADDALRALASIVAGRDDLEADFWLTGREAMATPTLLGTRWIPGDQGLTIRAEMLAYAAGAERFVGNSVSFDSAASAWQSDTAGRVSPAGQGEVSRGTATAFLDSSSAVEGLDRIQWHDGYGGDVTPVDVALPAVAVPTLAEPITCDGLLGDWPAGASVHDGPLVSFLDRPTVRSGQLRRAGDETRIYAGFTPAGLRLAFAVAADASGQGLTSRAGVRREADRVWGEDVVELVVRPITLVAGDARPGPTLHLTLKPTGGATAARRLDRRPPVPIAVPGEYAATTVDGIWRGEVVLSWSDLNATLPGDPLAAGRVPAVVAFNLSHHDALSGRSTSWAGPVDSGRDPHVVGALVMSAN